MRVKGTGVDMQLRIVGQLLVRSCTRHKDAPQNVRKPFVLSWICGFCMYMWVQVFRARWMVLWVSLLLEPSRFEHRLLTVCSVVMPTQNENKANTQNNKYDNNLLAKEPNKNITQIKTIKDKMFSFVELAASSTPERYQQSRLRGVTKRGMAQPRSKSRK